MVLRYVTDPLAATPDLVEADSVWSTERAARRRAGRLGERVGDGGTEDLTWDGGGLPDGRRVSYVIERYGVDEVAPWARS